MSKKFDYIGKMDELITSLWSRMVYIKNGGHVIPSDEMHQSVDDMISDILTGECFERNDKCPIMGIRVCGNLLCTCSAEYGSFEDDDYLSKVDTFVEDVESTSDGFDSDDADKLIEILALWEISLKLAKKKIEKGEL